MDNYVLFVALSLGDGIARVTGEVNCGIERLYLEENARKCFKGQMTNGPCVQRVRSRC